jgi:hypothetical protein
VKALLAVPTTIPDASSIVAGKLYGAAADQIAN